MVSVQVVKWKDASSRQLLLIGDLDVGPSPSRSRMAVSVSPADPFAKQTSLPNCCVKYVSGSGLLYDCP